MKAMILAAGLGTRLRPYTEHTPKALFPLAGRPLIDGIVDQLARAGCQAVVVNTHHLADRLEAHLAAARYPIAVAWIREAQILGTGGAIANAAGFFDHRPVMVVNADIDTDIDLGALYRFHLGHRHPASLALTDCPDFNTVSVTADGQILGFDPPMHSAAAGTDGAAVLKRTFTGIQVVDRAVVDRIDPGRPSSIIDVYRDLIAENAAVAGWFAPGRWADLGTPDRYLDAAAGRGAAEAFAAAGCPVPASSIRFSPLAGDGSSRRWFRASAGGRRLVMVSHGIRTGSGTEEVDAFVDIGRHLASCRVPVPKIFGFDRFSGLVFVEDLGDRHLQQAVAGEDEDKTGARYRAVVEAALQMGLSAAEGFHPRWAWQSPRYDRDLILEKECRYFCEAFVAGHLRRPDPFDDLAEEFSLLADRIEAAEVTGFIHRDLQSRNVMVSGGRFSFIDWQGGRIGPLQYDLASLLIDPYVALPNRLQEALIDHAAGRLAELAAADRNRCLAGIRYCALSRNLQILGAFGFLTARGKSWFAAAIPGALTGLKRVLAALPEEEFPKLTALARELSNA